jgi:hypothetical protein
MEEDLKREIDEMSLDGIDPMNMSCISNTSEQFRNYGINYMNDWARDKQGKFLKILIKRNVKNIYGLIIRVKKTG